MIPCCNSSLRLVIPVHTRPPKSVTFTNVQGEVRTQVVKWNSVCSSVHGVMSELLLAAELGALSKADFSKLTTKLYTQLCCFPVCIVSWLASYTHFGEGGRDGGRAGDGVTPFQVQDIVFFRDGIVLQVIDQFLDVTADMEDGESLQYFQQRSMMMVNIVRRYCFSFKV